MNSQKKIINIKGLIIPILSKNIVAFKRKKKKKRFSLIGKKKARTSLLSLSALLPSIYISKRTILYILLLKNI